MPGSSTPYSLREKLSPEEQPLGEQKLLTRTELILLPESVTIQESKVLSVEELVTTLTQLTVPPVGTVKRAGAPELELEIAKLTYK